MRSILKQHFLLRLAPETSTQGCSECTWPKVRITPASSRATPPLGGLVRSSQPAKLWGTGDQGRCAWGSGAFCHPLSWEVLTQMVSELMQLCSRGHRRKVDGNCIWKSQCLVSVYVGKVFTTIHLLKKCTHSLPDQAPVGDRLSHGQVGNTFALWRNKNITVSTLTRVLGKWQTYSAFLTKENKSNPRSWWEFSDGSQD